MKQIVDITERRPRPMARAVREEQAYKEHVSYQRRFDEERVAFGLEPRSSGPLEKDPQPADSGDSVLAEDGEPESIFASQFAGLADFMQSILDEKATKNQSQPQANSPTPSPGKSLQLTQQGRPQNTFDASISKIANGHMNGGIIQAQNSKLHGQTDQSLPAVSQPVISHSTEVRLAQAPIATTANIITTQTTKAGLMQSRWGEGQKEKHNLAMSFENRSGISDMRHGQAVHPAQTAPPAAQHPLASSIQSIAVLNGEAKGGGGVNASELSYTLPSGSSWW